MSNPGKWICFASLLGILTPAGAHPHMFIDTSLNIRLDGDRLAGLEITWFSIRSSRLPL